MKQMAKHFVVAWFIYWCVFSVHLLSTLLVFIVTGDVFNPLRLNIERLAAAVFLGVVLTWFCLFFKEELKP